MSIRPQSIIYQLVLPELTIRRVCSMGFATISTESQMGTRHTISSGRDRGAKVRMSLAAG